MFYVIRIIWGISPAPPPPYNSICYFATYTDHIRHPARCAKDPENPRVRKIPDSAGSTRVVRG